MYGLEEICHKCGKQFTNVNEVGDCITLVCRDCKDKEYEEMQADKVYFECDCDCDPIYISKSQGVLITTYDGGYCASATPIRALADFLNAYLKDHPEL